MMFDFIANFLQIYSFQLIGALEMGLIYSFVALGVYLTFRILDFPDLTADGSFPLGAAVTAVLLSQEVEPVLAMLASIAAGACAGLLTAWLHVRWKILNLLAGILTMTALYSINLRVMGRPNIALLEERTIFQYVSFLEPWVVLFILAVFIALVFLWFIHTKSGLALRALGANKKMAQAQGVSISWMTLLGLALSNGLIALGGSLFAQHAGFADVSLGVGTIIFGLAAVIIGEVVVPKRSLMWIVLSCILGSLLYRLVIAGALNMTALGMQPSDLNLMTALMVACAMIIPRFKKGGPL